MVGVPIRIAPDTLADVIEIVPYQDRWRAEFDAIGDRLRAALGEAALRIDHIGSTAVPGMAAKDVIDVQVTVADLDAAAALLVRAGFILKADVRADHCPPGMSVHPDDLEKRFFGMPAGERRAHIHVRRDGRFNQRYALLFRDYVRAHPEAGAAIGATKLALAKHVGHDVEAYYDIKDPAYDIVMAAAANGRRPRSGAQARPTPED